MTQLIKTMYKWLIARETKGLRRQINLTEHPVRNHWIRIFDNLDISSRVEANGNPKDRSD